MLFGISKKLAVLILIGVASIDDCAQAVQLQNIQKDQATVQTENDYTAMKVQMDDIFKYRGTHLLGSKQGINQLVKTHYMKEMSPVIKKLPKVKTNYKNEPRSLKPDLIQILPPDDKEDELTLPEMEDNEQKTGSQKFENKDKEQIEIVAEGGMDIKATQELDLDTEQGGEMSAEHKLEERINNQAKSILDQQIKAQAEAKAKGTLKISSAAAALNNAEMGMKAEVNTEEASRIMSISSDQLYFDEYKKADPAQQQPQKGEAAAITMAKQAAQQYIANNQAKKKSK